MNRSTPKTAAPWLHRVLRAWELPILLSVLAMAAVFSIAIDGFLVVKSFGNISRQITTIGIVSIGMTLVILVVGREGIGRSLRALVSRRRGPRRGAPGGSGGGRRLHLQVH